MALGDNLEKYTYDYILQTALSYVPPEVDKRQGSIIYDALAPTCYVLALAFMELRQFYFDAYINTATGEALDNKVAEQGITRLSATQAIKKGYFADSDGQPFSVPIGSRFSTTSDTNPIIYEVTAPYEEDGVQVPGTYELTCEEPGTIGNQYSGSLTAITFITGISTAEMSTLLVAARDTETDEDLRLRYMESLGHSSFGGNIEDYRQKCLSINGIGAVQIYPIWSGGGTVKLSIVDSEFNVCTSQFIDSVQTIIDPEVNQGTGLGIAPIGHTVTVVTPEEVSINVSTTIIPDSSHTIEELQSPIEEVISKYLDEVKRRWAVSNNLNQYSCSIYIARITAAIIGVSGVANVTSVEINDDTEDIVLYEDETLQQIPVLGTVQVDG